MSFVTPDQRKTTMGTVWQSRCSLAASSSISAFPHFDELSDLDGQSSGRACITAREICRNATERPVAERPLDHTLAADSLQVQKRAAFVASCYYRGGKHRRASRCTVDMRPQHNDTMYKFCLAPDIPSQFMCTLLEYISIHFRPHVS